MRDIAVARLGQALDQFLERPPHDLPDGLLDKLKDLKDDLAGEHPEPPSPGKLAAVAKMPAPPPEKKPEKEMSPGKQAANEGHERAAEAAKNLAEALVSDGRAGA